jgi:hypothetical protein
VPRALILTPEAYLALDLALPPEAWEFLDEFDEDEREEVAMQLRLAFVAGYYANQLDDGELAAEVRSLAIKDPCESTP